MLLQISLISAALDVAFAGAITVTALAVEIVSFFASRCGGDAVLPDKTELVSPINTSFEPLLGLLKLVNERGKRMPIDEPI